MGKIQIHISFKVCGQALPLLVQGFGDKDKVKLQPEVETASLMQISAAPGNKSSTKSLTKKICVDDILFDIQISQAFDGTCVRLWLTGPKILRQREALLSGCHNAKMRIYFNKLKNAFTSKINLGWQSEENLCGCCRVWRKHSLNSSGVSLG